MKLHPPKYLGANWSRNLYLSSGMCCLYITVCVATLFGAVKCMCSQHVIRHAAGHFSAFWTAFSLKTTIPLRIYIVSLIWSPLMLWVIISSQHTGHWSRSYGLSLVVSTQVTDHDCVSGCFNSLAIMSGRKVVNGIQL